MGLFLIKGILIGLLFGVPAGGCLILGMGIRMLMMKSSEIADTSGLAGGIRMFASSFAVGITNPAAILTFLFAFSWFGIHGRTGLAEGISLVCGVFIGTYIWWGTLSGAAAMFKKKSKKDYLTVMNRIFGILLILLAIVLSACGTSADENQSIRPAAGEETHSAASLGGDDEDNLAEVPEEISEDGQKASTDKNIDSNSETEGAQMQEMTVEAGGQKFKAVLYDNETVRALLDRLPMTLEMEELHGNEKFYYLDEGLPANSENVGTIKAGDIMLFGSDCLVVFFEDFSTSYNYTRIGHIKEEEAFVKELSGGTVEITLLCMASGRE